jgi:hypothetical protein
MYVMVTVFWRMRPLHGKKRVFIEKPWCDHFEKRLMYVPILSIKFLTFYLEKLRSSLARFKTNISSDILCKNTLNLWRSCKCIGRCNDSRGSFYNMSLPQGKQFGPWG